MYPNQPQSPPPQQPPQDPHDPRYPQYPPQAQGYAPQEQAYPQAQYVQQQPQQPTYQPLPQQTPYQPQTQPQQYPGQPNSSPYVPTPETGGIDYLNQIAPEKVSRGSSSKQRWILIILGLMIVSSFGIMAFTSTRSSSPENVGEMTQRVGALVPIVNNAQQYIQDSRLASINSTLRIYLSNATTTLTNGGEIKIDNKLSPLGDMSEKIEDGRLSGTFDRVYSREISFQIESLLITLNRIESTTSSTSQRESTAQLSQDLQPIAKGLSEFMGDAR